MLLCLRRRRRLLGPLFRTSFLRLQSHGASANPHTSSPRPAHRDLRSANNALAALARKRGAAAARAMFDGMPHRDAFSYATMITIHTRERDLPSAEALFLAVPKVFRGTRVHTAMLDGYLKAGLVDRARELFNGMAVTNVVAWTCMVSGYFRAGRVNEARQLFDLMLDTDVVSWTTMVQGYARNGMLKEAREMFDKMPERNVFAWTVMIQAYVDNHQILEAKSLFDRMSQRNSYTLNVMISGFLRAGKVDEAIQLFERMQLQVKDVVSWTIMVTALARCGFVCRARDFFNRMREKDTTAWNAMITAYSNDGQLNEAHRLFNLMPAKDLVSWSIIIYGYSKNGLKDEALSTFLLMRRSAFFPDSVTLLSILVICENIMEVAQIHGLATTLGHLSETYLGNCLVTMYSRSGDLHSAWLAFKRLEEKDVITWSAVLQAFVNHGRAHFALQGFAQMLKYGYKPHSTTFTAVLSACRHVGLVAKGLKIFRSIQHAYGLEATVVHYSCLVDLLGQAGFVREAKELVESMPIEMCDEGILGALLGACMMHNEIDAAREVGEILVKLEPSGSSGYKHLANIFASHKMWDELKVLWKIIKKRRSTAKKTPGFSKIEVNNEHSEEEEQNVAMSHVFHSSDHMHPQCVEIYEMLDDRLVPQMKNENEMV